MEMVTHPFPFEHPAYKATEMDDGIQYRFNFRNGYGASVIRHKYSYGFKDGLWEIGVTDLVGNLDYSTPITDDVIGYLTEIEIAHYLDKICRLEDKR